MTDPSGSDDQDAECHLKLRRYLLGLALVAATATSDELFDLREGCHFRVKPGTLAVWKAVPYRGKETDLPDLTDAVAMGFASAAAQAFGVAPGGEVDFDKAAAEKWLALKKDEQDKRRRLGPMTKQFEAEANPPAVGEGVAPTTAPRRGRRARPDEEAK